ncbi:MAG: hypothetical protein KGO53_13740 [Alphaproteobacteria bacterium]|nr:hypothetical protein [Alphaproteobacteria bacterium]
MNSSSIEKLLKARGAWLKPVRGEAAHAQARAGLSRLIADDYAGFEALRDRLFQLEHMESAEEARGLLDAPDLAAFHAALRQAGLGLGTAANPLAVDARTRRYLSGGWLEELAWLAAIEAGAHEAIYGQVVGWEFKGYSGENEIDLIMRRSDRLSFVSCKALRSELDINDRKHRNRLMDAVHEADNLADHFGKQGEKVAVLVTTDLYDEVKDTPRYQALMGKAAVLDVRLIALEELGWAKLVQALEQLMVRE